MIVRSREGDFLTQNCTKCGNPSAVRIDDIPSAQCPCCHSMLLPGPPRRTPNYRYHCVSCGLNTEIWMLVPSWHEHFPERGFAIKCAGASE